MYQGCSETVMARDQPLERHCLFQSFFMGGFECSTHRLKNGKRLDLVASTEHDRYAVRDYLRLHKYGIKVARDGVRWHLIERTPRRYDFSSLVPMLNAARETGTQVIWDLFHFGWPDDIDIFKPEFVNRLAQFSRATARVIRDETAGTPFLAPVNEISFVAWAGGDAAYINPYCKGRGDELKRQLVRAAIESTEAIRDVIPDCRIVHPDPVIHIEPDPEHPEQAHEASAYTLARYEGWDMLSGRLAPELGGHPRYLDIMGVNFYPRNEWIHHGRPIHHSEPIYCPFRRILKDTYDRYKRPMFVAETGTEDDDRAGWLDYIMAELEAALLVGIEMEAVCLYPIVNHPGWDDDRHCKNGLWDYADHTGRREVYQPLLHVIERWLPRIDEIRECVEAIREGGSNGQP